jgi:ESCRT-I complex subunit VPS28
MWSSQDCHSYYRLDILSGMSADEELDDGQVRQMLFDLDSAYNSFNRNLHDH